MVLGVLALNEGKVEEAKEHLLDSLGSPPGDCPDALVYRLTRIFWQMGEREVLSRYLSQCRVQWPESNIEPWLTDMSARWPEFAAWANKQPRLVKPIAGVAVLMVVVMRETQALLRRELTATLSAH